MTGRTVVGRHTCRACRPACRLACPPACRWGHRRATWGGGRWWGEGGRHAGAGTTVSTLGVYHSNYEMFHFVFPACPLRNTADANKCTFNDKYRNWIFFSELQCWVVGTLEHLQTSPLFYHFSMNWTDPSTWIRKNNQDTQQGHKLLAVCVVAICKERCWM